MSDRADRPRIEWIDSPVCLLRLRDHWDRYLDEWGVDCVFLSWDWVRVWLRTLGRGAQLRVGVVHDGEETIGIAPLILSRRRLTRGGPVLRTVTMLGDGPLCPDHLVLPVAPGREDAFAQIVCSALQERRSEWDRIVLRDLLDAHPAWRALRAAFEMAGAKVHLRETTTCPYLPLPESWDAYLKSLGKKTRATIRQKLTRIEKDFHTALFQPTSIAEVDRIIGLLEDLHTRAWRERGRPGVFADPTFRTFHRLHARRAYRSRRLRLSCLQADGRDIGATLCFLGRNRVHGYQLGHDPELRRYGIGTLMIAISIREAIEEGLAEMDFLRGSGPYKFHLASEVRRGREMIVHSGTYADRLARLIDQSRRRVSDAAGRLLGGRGKQWLKDRLRSD